MVFYNFVYKHNKEQYLSLSEITANKNSCSLFRLKNIYAGEHIKYFKNFSIKSTRSININNNCFIISGNAINNRGCQGNNNVFRIDYRIKLEEDKSSKEIILTKLNNTLYNHKYHHLIYSHNFNILFVLSGENQLK